MKLIASGDFLQFNLYLSNIADQVLFALKKLLSIFDLFHYLFRNFYINIKLEKSQDICVLVTAKLNSITL